MRLEAEEAGLYPPNSGTSDRSPGLSEAPDPHDPGTARGEVPAVAALAPAHIPEGATPPRAGR